MEQEIADFNLYLASEKGVSPHTQEAYVRDVQHLAAFLQRKAIRSFKRIQTEDLVAFLASLRLQGYASSSLYRVFMSIRIFARFLKREGEIPLDWTLYLEAPQVWQQIPEVLSCREVESLLQQPDPSTPSGARDKAILELLYSSGLRVSELCQLGLYDVDDDYVKVTGKGNKQRLVPVGKRAIAALDHYLTHFYPEGSSEANPPLFVNRRNRRMDRIQVWRMIKLYGKQAGIAKVISPHTLRHSFATHLLDNGAELRVIQEMMGHAHISSTDRYMHMSRKKIQESFHAFHPKR